MVLCSEQLFLCVFCLALCGLQLLLRLLMLLLHLVLQFLLQLLLLLLGLLFLCRQLLLCRLRLLELCIFGFSQLGAQRRNLFTSGAGLGMSFRHFSSSRLGMCFSRLLWRVRLRRWSSLDTSRRPRASSGSSGRNWAAG